MSCITSIGRHDFLRPGCDVPLNHTAPLFNASKLRRLERMASDDDPAMRAVAASHPKCPSSALVRLILDEDVRVRRAAVKNPNLTERLLVLALNDNDLGIRAYARMLQEE